MSILKKFDKYAALKAFVGRVSERALGNFLDQAGGIDVVCKAIESGILITDKIPLKDKMVWREQLQPWKGIFHVFNDNDIYYWIPARYREFCEKKYGPVYTEYMIKQCKAIRDFLTD